MRLASGTQEGAHALELLGQRFAAEPAAHQLEMQKDEIGIEHIGLAIAADALDPALQPRVPDLRAGEAQLAGKPQEHGHICERSLRASLEPGQYVHEIEMPPVIAIEIIVETKA